LSSTSLADWVASRVREPRVAMRTLGCKVNQAEAESIAAELLGRGVEIVDEEDAEIVIVTTCTVTGEADRKARKAVRHALRLPAEPMVVVTGCLAAIDGAELAAFGDRVVVEADKSAVAARVGALVKRTRRGKGPAVRAGAAFHTRAMVKVQDGCDAFCAYCIVPHARGVPTSVPHAQVLAEVERLVSAGVAEVVLTGINIGRYDDDGLRLPDLLRAVAATGVRRVRVSSIEPEDVTEAFVEAAAETPAFCRHLHVPLQSGCDRTLAAMGRRYDTAGFAEMLARARARLPGLAVTTDVLVGFPGETDVDFAQTLTFVRECFFTRLHVFRYSVRAGTRAAALPGRVPPEILATRAAAMRHLDAACRRAFSASMVGETAELLVERIIESPEGPMAVGTTREYLHVSAPGAGRTVGEVAEVRIAAMEGGRLLARW